MATLCDTNVAQPVDATTENTWPGFLRAFKAETLGSVLKEHTCDGTHLKGTDTLGTGTNMQVDVGGNATYISAAYAGLLVKVLPIVNNTAGGTLTVKSGSTTIAAGPIWLNGGDPGADTIVAGQWLEMVWDGTNWQIVSGYDTNAIIDPQLVGVLRQHAIQNGPALIQIANTDITAWSIPVGVNTDTIYRVQGFIHLYNNTGNNHDFELKAFINATQFITILPCRVRDGGGSYEVLPFFGRFAGGQVAPATLTIHVYPDANSANLGCIGGVAIVDKY